MSYVTDASLCSWQAFFVKKQQSFLLESLHTTYTEFKAAKLRILYYRRIKIAWIRKIRADVGRAGQLIAASISLIKWPINFRNIYFYCLDPNIWTVSHKSRTFKLIMSSFTPAKNNHLESFEIDRVSNISFKLLQQYFSPFLSHFRFAESVIPESL